MRYGGDWSQYILYELQWRFEKDSRICKAKKTNWIIVLQETHNTPEMEQRWLNDWGNKQMYFSHGASNSKRELVAIIITNDYDANPLNIRRDTNWRMILLDIEKNGTMCTVGNIYAPTWNFEQEQRLAFREFTNYLDQIQNEHVVLGGDYNLYMNPRLDKLDTMPEHNDNQNYREDITSFLEINNLAVWRTLHTDEKCFTWHPGNKRTRLGCICSDHLLNFIEDSSILPGIESDHSLLQLSLIFGNKRNRGKRFWKFKSSLPHDSFYAEIF